MFLGLSFQGNGILNKVSFLHYIRNEKRGHRLLLQVQIIVTFVKNSDSFFFLICQHVIISELLSIAAFKEIYDY